MAEPFDNKPVFELLLAAALQDLAACQLLSGSTDIGDAVWDSTRSSQLKNQSKQC